MVNELLPCPLCQNDYLAIRDDIYKDKREFVYCDACGCLADRRIWNCFVRMKPAQQDAPTDADDAFIRAALDYRTAQVPQDANAAYVRLYAAASALFAPAQDAEREREQDRGDADVERIAMDALKYIGNFFCDDTDGDDWHLKCHALYALERIDAARAQRAAAQGDGDGR